MKWNGRMRFAWESRMLESPVNHRQYMFTEKRPSRSLISRRNIGSGAMDQGMERFLGVRRLALAAVLTFSQAALAQVNDPAVYPVNPASISASCAVDAGARLSTISPLIYGTNLEWFNDAGGLIDSAGRLDPVLVNDASFAMIPVFRFPGGILADYYHWQDGIGPLSQRKVVAHPTDSGASLSLFGTPQLAQFLAATGSQALITANAGTGTAAEAAGWVDYANNPGNAKRIADGFPRPLNFKLWEIGNELYYPGNPGNPSVALTPQVYATRFLDYAAAMRAVDPGIQLLAIGADHAGVGPASPYASTWTPTVLQAAADQIDYIAVHNGYFPVLYNLSQPSPSLVYPAVMAAPEAVDASLGNIENLIAQYQKSRPINIAITEWGPFYSIPRADPYWVDHIKTQGSAVYVARMYQVFLSHPKVKLANFFKFVDSSYTGWINYDNIPKVPAYAYAMFSILMRGSTVATAVAGSATYDTPQVGNVPAMNGVKELTAVSSIDPDTHTLHVSLVNRSMSNAYSVNLQLSRFGAAGGMTVYKLAAPEPTSHSGNDVRPTTPGYNVAYEPYSSIPPEGITVTQQFQNITQPVTVPPFGVVIVEVAGDATGQ